MKLSDYIIITIAITAILFIVNGFFYLINTIKRKEEENFRLRDENSRNYMKNTAQEGLITMILNNWKAPQPAGLLSQRSVEITNDINNADNKTEPLTDRHLEIAKLLIADMSAKQIAKELNLSVNTVNNHLAEMKRRTCTNSSKGLVAYILKNNLITTYYSKGKQ